MIAGLRGVVAARRPPLLALDVGGVIYEMQAPLRAFDDLPPVGEKAQVLTHMATRNDTPALYAFAHESDLGLFRALLRVSGIGAQMALAILSTMDARLFGECVAADDVARLTRVPGVGKKTAERVLLEMRDRLADAPWARALGGEAPRDRAGDAAEALVALGYKQKDAERMIRNAGAAPDAEVEELIRAALRAGLR